MRKRITTATALLLFTSYGTAFALTADQISRIEGHFATAIAEQQVNLTCSMTMEPRMRDSLQSGWANTADDVLDDLADADFPAAALADLRDKTRVDAVIMPGNTPFSEVIALCHEHADWRVKLAQFRFFDLSKHVDEVLEEQ